MGRKVHMKKERSRDAFLAAKALGAPILFQTSTGSVALNPMKHYCLQRPYNKLEYQEIMAYKIKSMRENFDKARRANEAKKAGAASIEV